MSKPYRIFVAHPKSFDEERIASLCTRLRNTLQEKNPELEIQITSARDDYSQRALRCGGWDAWCRSVVDVVDYVSRDRRFHAITIPICEWDGDRQVSVGRATAMICQASAAAEVPVLVFDAEARVVFRATGAATVDAENWKFGWRILY